MKLEFDHAENGLISFRKELTTFKIAGENRRFYPAEAMITKDGV